ncbi:MAG: hypothetical protein L0Z62_12530 [Gemmataceae bacterium]|nr:hypothetical protein [Gemmataceae bacterium]
MSKPWQEKPLWERVWLGPHSRIYLHAAKIIGHRGCSPFEFFDAAKQLPFYNQYLFENAVRDLTVYAAREGSPPRYELHANARKLLWIILGPPPDHPEYVRWWTGRLISVRLMRQEGTEPEFAVEPPVPLPEQKPGAPKKQRRKKKAS